MAGIGDGDIIMTHYFGSSGLWSLRLWEFSPPHTLIFPNAEIPNKGIC
jgi:hypothetical protein